MNDVQDLIISAINQGQLIRSTNDPRIDQKFSGLPRDFELSNVEWRGPHNSSTFKPIKLKYTSQIFDRCFLAGTKIELACGSRKNIENIVVGDIVASFNPSEQGGAGEVAAKKVSRIFKNFSDSIINLRGLYCTPGHVFLDGESLGSESKFKTISEILLSDGCITAKDGAIIRARTGNFAGSLEDRIVKIVYRDQGQQDNILHVRAGIPVQVGGESGLEGQGSKYISLADWLRENSIKINYSNRYEDAYGSEFDLIRWPKISATLEMPNSLNWVVKKNGQMMRLRG